MGPAGSIDILSSHYVECPVQVSLEHLYINRETAFFPWLLLKKRKKGNHEIPKPNIPSGNDSDGPQGTVETTSREKECVTYESSGIGDIVAYRIAGRLTINGHNVCEPVYSSIIHLHLSPLQESSDGLLRTLCGSRIGCPTGPDDLKDTNNSLTINDKGLYEKSSTTIRDTSCEPLGCLLPSDFKVDHTAHTTLEIVIPLSCVFTFSYNICDLPLNSMLELDVYGVDCGVMIAHSAFPLFGTNAVFRADRFLVPLRTVGTPRKETLNLRSRGSICSKVSQLHSLRSRTSVVSRSFLNCYNKRCSLTSYSAPGRICFGHLLNQNAFHGSKPLARCNGKYKQVINHIRNKRWLTVERHDYTMKNQKNEAVTQSSNTESVAYKGDHTTLPTPCICKNDADFLSYEDICTPSDLCNSEQTFNDSRPTLSVHGYNPACSSGYESHLFQSYFPTKSGAYRTYRDAIKDTLTTRLRKRLGGYRIDRGHTHACLSSITKNRGMTQRRKKHMTSLHNLVQTRMVAALEQHVIRAVTSYRMLDSLARRKPGDNFIGTQRCRLRLKTLCTNSIVYTASYFSYISLRFPGFAAPVLFSTTVNEEFYGLHRKELLDTRREPIYSQGLVKSLGQSHCTRNSNYQENPGRHLQVYPISSNKVALVDVESTKKSMCKWFLRCWTPLGWAYREMLFFFLLQGQVGDHLSHSASLRTLEQSRQYQGDNQFQYGTPGLVSRGMVSQPKAKALTSHGASNSRSKKGTGLTEKKTTYETTLEFVELSVEPMQYLHSSTVRIAPHQTWLETRPPFSTASADKTLLGSTTFISAAPQQDRKAMKDSGLLGVQSWPRRGDDALPFTKPAAGSTVGCGIAGVSKSKVNEFKRVLYLALLPEPYDLSMEDKKLIWDYREILRIRGIGLLKLSNVVSHIVATTPTQFENGKIMEEFLKLVDTWPTPSIYSALELLSPLSTIPAVRQLAVSALDVMRDDEFVNFLPQLMQALRDDVPGAPHGSLLHFLVKRSLCSPLIASGVYWDLQSEIKENEQCDPYPHALSLFTEAFSGKQATHLSQNIAVLLQLQKNFVTMLRKLASQIHGKWDRADRKTIRLQELLSQTHSREIDTTDGSPNKAGATQLLSLHDPHRLSYFTNSFRDGVDLHGISHLNLLFLKRPFPLPIAPYYHVLGVIPEKCYVVRSSQYPIVLTLRVLIPPPKPSVSRALQNSESLTSSTENMYDHWFMCEKELRERGYTERVKRYLYKVGDDLRQDRLVMQLLSIFEFFLVHYGCQYCLTKYNITVLSRTDGFIEFIEGSQPISSIKRSYPTLKKYFASVLNPNIEQVPAKILDTFIRSCSAFSVATFLLGVGDRHLDNLLISKDGRLFHVDFAFILGEDPKPFAPPMKLCREIIEALGGPGSKGYEDFQRQCCQTFRILRRHAKVVIDILLLMVYSGIRALRHNPFEAIARVRDKFQLNASEVDAEAYLLNVISVSASAFFPAVVDKFHEWAVYWR